LTDLGSCTIEKSLHSNPIPKLSVCAWNPHHTSQFTTTTTNSIDTWDTRTYSVVSTLTNVSSNNGVCLDIDYNPNKPYQILTAYNDNKIRIYDTRRNGELLKVLCGHSHWVTGAKFNRFHDQLILSGSSDSNVNLWRVSSTSSAPLLDYDDDEDDVKETVSSVSNLSSATPAVSNKLSKEQYSSSDGLVQSYDEHEESVYGVTWSNADPWVFASLSYDGRVIVNNVPSDEMYKILL
jgi:WD40 repeat protein